MYTIDRDTAVTPQLAMRFAKRHQNEAIRRFDMLDDYYCGRHEILRRSKEKDLANNRLVCNHAKYISDMAIGYLIGGIKIRGVELGTAGVLLAALVFGHFGVEIPSVVRNFGLATFVASVGFIAGPKFFRDFRKNAKNYILLGFLIILSGALCCVLTVKIAASDPSWPWDC